MNLDFVWSIVGWGVAVGIVFTAVSFKRRLAGPYDLGSLSSHWVAEHRAHQSSDAR